jgi:MFS transporter, FSR family, fosmidomycin resistance protein
MAVAATDGAASHGSARITARRTLAVCCGAHVLHDGYTDLIYVLLPVWQAEFGLPLALVGLLRTLYSGSMALLQMPSSVLAERVGARAVLALGTVLAGTGYLIAGWSGGAVALGVCLLLGGAGSSTQHPLGAALTAQGFAGGRLRAALGTYNFAGDVGKVLLPAATAAMVAAWDWRWAAWLLGLGGIAAGILIQVLLRAAPFGSAAARAGDARSEASSAAAPPPAAQRRGFLALSAIGVVDAATRTGFLTLLPFLLAAKGAALPTVGVALSLVFAGGAMGKFVCGLIADRAGVLRTVIVTECATAAGILLILPVPLETALCLLPVIGLALNGTSSVLYGTVAELAPPARHARAFGIFYTVTIGAAAIAPTLYGRLADGFGVPTIVAVVALVVLLVPPLTLPLRVALAEAR